MDKGYVHIYTGNGKGKTTAAFGVAVRSLMCDKKIYIGQFIKGMKYSETQLGDYFKNITIEQYGKDCFIKNAPTKDDIKLVVDAYDKALKIVSSNNYDLVILDEIFIAHYYKMINLNQLIDLIKSKSPTVELILTGRYCPEELYEYADLVTEMIEIKHYYNQGVLSRKGIDF